jgi:hypothetical protein
MDLKFWKFIWLLIASVTCVFIISMTSCQIHQEYRIAKAIESGVNPLEAQYALGYSRYTDLAILRLSENK